ncbi:MAG: zinc metallopeptidase [Cyclobacteriaceae bacterium]|nr:zinc metallopeptidase [Cyclobacteriaceae bacterium]MCB0498889.1 zinc metallopeptidase [Cyclobacteriaceae bacterium]MCB9237597.1 zinc metallopeptidase [Flammeovirgaceae bacterium]MCO5270301.1 zinc metallopeptidase [Cyclobacteriaceae bacterium]MCW5902277.1 zinc metallopeptidase [Cyclobacteriaceae bacterium]
MVIYYVIIGFFMLLSWVVSSRLKNKFRKYSQIQLAKDLTGADVARLMLADNGIHDVKVTCVNGELTDHYNPANKTVNLSEPVYNGRNAAATAVAAHECGHAVQHATAYSMLGFRSALVPIQNISGTIQQFVMIALFFGGAFIYNALPTAILLIVGCNLVFTLFAFVTLPVEYDASKRALVWIEKRGIVNSSEHAMAKDALNTAARTYVVAAMGALASLLFWVMMFLGGSRD